MATSFALFGQAKAFELPEAFKNTSTVKQSAGGQIDFYSDGKRFIASKKYSVERFQRYEQAPQVMPLMLAQIENVQACLGLSSAANGDPVSGYFSLSSDVLAPLFDKYKQSQTKFPESLIAKVMNDISKAGLALERKQLWHPGISCDSIFLEESQFKLTNPFLDDKFIVTNLEAWGQQQPKLSQTVAQQANLNANQLGLTLLQLCSLTEAEAFASNGQYNKDKIREALKVANLNYSSQLVDAIELMIKGRSQAGLITFEDLNSQGRGKIAKASTQNNLSNQGGLLPTQYRDSTKGNQDKGRQTGNLTDLASITERPTQENEADQGYRTDNPDQYRPAQSSTKRQNIAEVVWGKGLPMNDITATKNEDDAKETKIFRNDVSVGPVQTKSLLLPQQQNMNPSQSAINPVDLTSFHKGNVPNQEPTFKDFLDITQQVRAKGAAGGNITNPNATILTENVLPKAGERSFFEATNLQVKDRMMELLQPTVVVEGKEQSMLGMYPVGYRNDFEDKVYNKVASVKAADQGKNPQPENSYYRNTIGPATAHVLKGEMLGVGQNSIYQGQNMTLLNQTQHENTFIENDRSRARNVLSSDSLAKRIMIGSNLPGDSSKKVDELDWGVRKLTSQKLENTLAPKKHTPVLAFSKSARKKQIFGDGEDELHEPNLVNLSNVDRSLISTVSVAEKIIKDIEGHNLQQEFLDISAIQPRESATKPPTSIVIDLNDDQPLARDSRKSTIVDQSSRRITPARSQSVGMAIAEATLGRPVGPASSVAYLSGRPLATHPQVQYTMAQPSPVRQGVSPFIVHQAPPVVLPITPCRPSMPQGARISPISAIRRDSYTSASETPLVLGRQAISATRIGPHIQVQHRPSVLNRPMYQQFFEYKPSPEVRLVAQTRERPVSPPNQAIADAKVVYQWHPESQEYWKFAIDSSGNRALVGKQKDLPLST